MLQDITNISIIATAITGIITLLLSIKKALAGAKPLPFRRKLEYINGFGDYIVNAGTGYMTILNIKFYYENDVSSENSLVELLSSKLQRPHSLVWDTYLRNSEIVNRTVPAGETLRLVSIDPSKQTYSGDLLKDLLAEQNKINIEVTYKNAYGVKKTIKL